MKILWTCTVFDAKCAHVSTRLQYYSVTSPLHSTHTAYISICMLALYVLPFIA